MSCPFLTRVARTHDDLSFRASQLPGYSAPITRVCTHKAWVLTTHMGSAGFHLTDWGCDGYLRFLPLTRARPEGHICAPHRFFADSRKMAARSAAKFVITIHSSFAHLV